MDPCFIFNHARPGPICLVYSVEERTTSFGGDHYLDTRLINEAGLGRCRRCLCCCRCWTTAWIFFLCPLLLHPASAPSDCQIAQCFGHGNKHTHNFLPSLCPLWGVGEWLLTPFHQRFRRGTEGKASEGWFSQRGFPQSEPKKYKKEIGTPRRAFC